jgi:methyl coenzyme M reductase subunit C-like uncharacterized protein (methanogenesis marker protein 7)
MEISSSNDGLLTNIEVYDLIEMRRQQRGANRTIAIELQNRERVEIQVTTLQHLFSDTNFSFQLDIESFLIVPMLRLRMF